MGYLDAVRDGIRTSTNGAVNNYYPKCHACGNEMMSWKYESGQKYTCRACKFKESLKEKENRVAQQYVPKEKKLDNAAHRISLITGIGKYKNAIKAIKQRLHDDKAFESTEEIMAALELERCGIPYRHQVKFGRYRADFVLPGMKVVFEVDGTIFHGKEKRERENLRDNLIVLSLGAEWEVVRITDELINSKITRLVPAIRAIKEKRQLIRRQYHGELPTWYSDRA